MMHRDVTQTAMDVLIDALVQTAGHKDEEHERKLDKVHDSPLETLTPWLRRTMWKMMFLNKEMKELMVLMEKPSANEPGLRKIWTAVEQLVGRSFDGVKDCWTRGWSLIPFWLVSPHKNQENSRPFRIHYHESTIARYATYWQQFIMFCMRASLVNPDEQGLQFHPIELEKLHKLREKMELEDPSMEKLQDMMSLSKLG
jgi:hypothetical protein